MAAPHQRIHNKRNKKRNTAGHKPKWFAQMVNEITKDCTLTVDELTASRAPDTETVYNDSRIEIKKDELPEGTTVVETLAGHWAFSDARLMRHMDTVHAIQKEFSDGFWGDGLSIMDLRVDRKNRVWADDQTILHLVYLMLAMNLAVYPLPRSEWKNLKSGMPAIKFTSPRRGEKEEETINNE